MSLADRYAAGPPSKDQARPRLEVDAGPDGGEFKNFVSDQPIEPADYPNAFSEVFRLAGLDSDDYRIVGGTVRFRAYQTLIKGTKDAKTLFSYGARFERITEQQRISSSAIERWRRNLTRTKFPAPRKQAGGTYTIFVADPQIGKPDTQQALENWRNGVTEHLRAAQHLDTAAVHIAFMGDEIEGVANNYNSQPYDVELSQSEQLETDWEMRIWTLKQALLMGVPVSASSVISNHGEWTRNGSKEPVTSAYDNASTHVARLVRTHFQALEEHGVPKIDWHIGDTTPGVTLTLSGVKCYFTHGYVERGRGATTEAKVKAALERQILGRTETLGDVKLWFAAHYHHSYHQEFEGRTLFGCPALEAERSSQYMLDHYGVWSPPGMLGLLITDKNARGWAHKNVF